MDPARELAQLLERLPELALGALKPPSRRLGVTTDVRARHPESERE
jgi:hypothetical protein